MTCDSVAELIPLYYYGELTPDDEDRLEAHVYECSGCAREMDRQRAFAAALDRRRAEVPDILLEDCRADMLAAIQGGAPRTEKTVKGAWGLFLNAISATFGEMTRFRQPAAAAGLIALGFLLARFGGNLPFTHSGVTTASLTPSADAFSTVRSVQPDNAGRVQIAFDETRRRVVSGRTGDPDIQKLLLAAAREENTAVRMESVDLLRGRADSVEVRDALLNALAHDSNASVRMKAIEGLKPFASDPAVRKTLAQVLASDDNPAVRREAIDLLVAHRDDSTVSLLQSLVQREDNGYVRLKCEKALKEMNASIGTY